MKRKLFLSLLLALTAAISLNGQGRLAKHVVFIGLDGWAANTFHKSDMPFVKNLAEEGAISMEKRAVLPSASAINWATIFMGVGSDVHGYLTWGSKTPDMRQPSGVVEKNGIFPTIFQIARDQHPKANLAVFASWDVIKHLVDSLSLDTFGSYPDRDMVSRTVEYLNANKPELMAVIFDDPDHTGHQHGWGSAEYYETMRRLDGYIADIFKGLEEAGMIDDTMVIITGDHGGIDKGHGSTSMSEVESPIVIWGKGVKKGTEITDMVMGYDVAPTIARALGLKTPAQWRGKAITRALKK